MNIFDKNSIDEKTIDEYLVTLINVFQLLNTVPKSSILDVTRDPDPPLEAL